MSLNRRVFVVGLWGLWGLWALGCTHGQLKGAIFEKGNLSYHVAKLDFEHWNQLKVSGNDLAFMSREGGFLLALNSTCKEHGDAPLEALTQHLLIGFTQREKLESQRIAVDGREGLVSRYVAKMDGVARELDLFVFKKDGCIFDISYIAPQGRGERWRGEFERMVEEFWAKVR